MKMSWSAGYSLKIYLVTKFVSLMSMMKAETLSETDSE